MDAKKFPEKYPMVYRQGEVTLIGWVNSHAGTLWHFDGENLVGFSHHHELVGGKCSRSSSYGQPIELGRRLIVDRHMFRGATGIAPCTYLTEWTHSGPPPTQCEVSNLPVPEFPEDQGGASFDTVDFLNRYPEKDAQAQVWQRMESSVAALLSSALPEVRACIEREALRRDLVGYVYLNLDFDESHQLVAAYERHFFPDPTVLVCFEEQLLSQRLTGMPEMGPFTYEARIPIGGAAPEQASSP